MRSLRRLHQSAKRAWNDPEVLVGALIGGCIGMLLYVCVYY